MKAMLEARMVAARIQRPACALPGTPTLADRITASSQGKFTEVRMHLDDKRLPTCRGSRKGWDYRMTGWIDLRAGIDLLGSEHPGGYSTSGATGVATSLSPMQSRGCELVPPATLLPDNPTLTNRLPWRTASTAASSWLPA